MSTEKKSNIFTINADVLVAVDHAPQVIEFRGIPLDMTGMDASQRISKIKQLREEFQAIMDFTCSSVVDRTMWYEYPQNTEGGEKNENI